MAIQMRRGANADFDASKMLAGEIAVTTDGSRKVYAAFGPNDVKELASKADVQNLINNFSNVVEEEIADAERRIESKGQEVLDTIPDLYEEVSAKADEAVRTKADAIICTESGETIVVQDSSDDYIRNLKIYGKTTQESTSGKNLLENTAVTTISGGITFTVNDDGSVTVSGTATATTSILVNTITLPSGEYILSGTPSGIGSSCVRGYVGDTQYIDSNGSGVALSFTEDTEIKVFVMVYSGETVSNLTFHPMIRLASVTDDTYEPYTGGQPSPSPSYPQSIDSKGKWGNIWHISFTEPITKTGVTVTPLENGNISINGTKTSNVWIELGTVTLTAGETYTLSAYSQLNVQIYDGVANEVLVGKSSGYGSTTFTANNTGTHTIVLGETSTITTYDNIVANIMLNEGTTPLPYRPYSGQREIESGVYGKNLCPVGDNNESWGGIVKTVNRNGSITFKGTLTTSYMNFVLAQTGTYTLQRGKYIATCKGLTENVKFICNTSGSDDGAILTNTLSEATFEITEDEYTFQNLVIQFLGGGNTFDVTLYPMIRPHGTDDTFVPYTKQSHISLVSDGLKGIPVTDASLATYTDENGQMWCSDYVDCDRGVLVQNIFAKVFEGNENIVLQKTGYNDEIPYFGYSNTLFKNNTSANWTTGYKCNKLIETAPNNLWLGETGFSIDINDNNIRLRPNIDGVTDATTFIAKLKEWYDNGEPLIIYGIRRTPIETPLSASEIESCKALRSNKPYTTVVNDCDAFSEVTYNADIEIWINNKIEEKIAAAVEKLSLS